MSYIDGFVIPVPAEKKQAYIEMAKTAQAVYLEHGAQRIVESWGDDLPKGKINDFHTAVVAEANEGVIFSWIEWPDKATRDSGIKKIMADPRMQPGPDSPYSGARLIYGGFTTLLDSKNK
jgi:uncharacterized protein YbaA (DUF1428 family)